MGNRIYTAASCTFGTHIDEAMERALRRNRFKNMEFDAGIVHYKKDERADQTIARMQSLVKDGAIVLKSNHLPWPAELNISSYEEADRAAACENTRKLILKLEEMGLGSPAYTFHGGTEPTTDEERAHRLAQTRKSIAELAPFFAERNAQMNVEILPRSCGGNCVEEMQYFMDGQPDNVGIVFDVNHVMNRAEQLPQMIRTLAPRIHAFHLSDYDNVDEQHWTIPHCGTINWQAVMAAIREIEQDVYMIFETHCPQSVTWRGNTEYDGIIRMMEYSAYYLENVDRFAELDHAFNDFQLPGN